MNNGFHVEQGSLKYFVDYNEIEVAHAGHLHGGVLEPRLNHLGAVLATPLQARLKFFPARRQDEDQHRVGKGLFDLRRTLEINFQHHIRAMGNAVFNRLL